MWSMLSRVLTTRKTLSVLHLIATHNSVQHMDTPRVNRSLPQKEKDYARGRVPQGDSRTLDDSCVTRAT
jgi:ribosomal protein L30/L7E